MKKAKRKRPVVAPKRKVTVRKKPATSRKKRKAKMSKKSNDDNDDEPHTAAKHSESRRTAGDQPEQTSDPVELAKKQHGGVDPMGQPPDSPPNPNLPPEEPEHKTK